MKKKFVDYYMNVAELTSTLSYARRLQVGAVIVKGNKILATGYNGMPAGWDNNCEDKVWDSGAGGWLDPEEFREKYPYEEELELIDPDDGSYTMTRYYGLKTKPEVLHAETNAIAKVSSSTESSEDATIFCTHAPCLQCAKLIYQSGIKSLFYRDTYHDDSGLNFLQKS
jgi:dCMP deaminase